MPIQVLDIILFVIMLVSGLLAMLRGLVREVLSIMSWALAALLALLAYSYFRTSVRGAIEPQMLADGLLIASVFIVALILFSLITSNISERVLDSSVGAADKTLGFVYGLVRGLILVVIAYLIVSKLVEKQSGDTSSFPAWVRDASSFPLIVKAAEGIKSLLPDNPDWFYKQRGPVAAPPSEADRN